MIKNRQDKKGPSDYKEPYEFRLLIGDNIICQRYFRINNFNQSSLYSIELLNSIRYCADMINEDLKSKSRIYTWHMAPLIFKNESEMRNWFSNEKNSSKVRCGENIVLMDNKESEYMWNGESLVYYEKKINDGTFTSQLTDKDIITYEFAFYVNDKKIISTIFEGVYPYFIRRNIDLSNTRGKFEGEDISVLGFESYILNRLVHDRQDLIKKIVKELCSVCSVTEDSYYTNVQTFVNKNNDEVKYRLDVNSPKAVNKLYAKEIADAKKYLYGAKA